MAHPGDHLTIIMQRRSITVAALSATTGLSPDEIRRLQRADDWSASTLDIICRALRTRPETFYPAFCGCVPFRSAQIHNYRLPVPTPEQAQRIRHALCRGDRPSDIIADNQELFRYCRTKTDPYRIITAIDGTIADSERIAPSWRQRVRERRDIILDGVRAHQTARQIVAAHPEHFPDGCTAATRSLVWRHYAAARTAAKPKAGTPRSPRT